MKNIILACLFILSTSTNAFAFDWHGIKSGMTRAQVESTMMTLGAKKTQYAVNRWEDFGSMQIRPHAALVQFDHAGNLLALNLWYSVPFSSFSATTALKAVLETKFKAQVLHLKSDEQLQATLVDEAAQQRDIEYYIDEYDKTL